MSEVLGYDLEAEVGRGVGTVVHRARRLAGGEVVAVKMAAHDPGGEPRQAVQRRLRREVEALSALTHPGLVPLVDVVELPRRGGRLRLHGTTDGPSESPTDLALVLAWAPLGSLADLARSGPIDPTTVIEMGCQLAGALAALHAAGIVHGDVAPGNVLHAHEHRWWLADLGDTRRTTEPFAGTRRGTQGCIAPEVLVGAITDEAADVFALARVLAAALGPRGHRPAPGCGAPVSGGLSALIARAAAADPSDRPTATELATELAGLRSAPVAPTFVDARVSIEPGVTTRDLPLPCLPSPLPPPAPPTRVSSKVRLAAATVGATLLALLVVLALGARVPGSRSVTRSAAAGMPSSLDPAPADPAPADPTPVPCPGSDVGTPPGAVAVPADLDGAGCTVTVLWWSDRAEAERPGPSGTRSRFAIGRPGDQLVLGDWDGDGRDTPALYEAITGLLTRFDGWADRGQPLAGRIVTVDAPRDGIARVRRVDGPDVIDVDPAPP